MFKNRHNNNKSNNSGRKNKSNEEDNHKKIENNELKKISIDSGENKSKNKLSKAAIKDLDSIFFM